MQFGRRLYNWQQVFGVLVLAGAMCLWFTLMFQPSMRMAGAAAFASWLGGRLWMVGTKLAEHQRGQ